MPIVTDFLLLYQELGITPNCSIEHFKLAYRRRISALHPDHAPASGEYDFLERLQTLTRLHDAAMQFHDRHGRLPGANQEPVAPGPQARQSPTTVARRTSFWHSAYPWICIVVVGAIVWAFASPELSPPEAAPPQSGAVAAAQTDAARAKGIIVGMDETSVRAILGEPTIESRERWEYGPSFVRFERHKVVDWYSSPVYPLKTSSQKTPKANPVERQ